MIPRAYITAWGATAPWPSEEQVEQDLVISRAIVAIFSHPQLTKQLAFRGGTALYKLHLKPAARYSEDIDLVQVQPGSFGEIIDALREVLGPWLGQPRRDAKQNSVTLKYRFTSENGAPLRLKVEVNTREHFATRGWHSLPFAVESPWFRGTAHVLTYDLVELLGTKLRALFQRRKGRDLFDLALALEGDPKLDGAAIVEVFQQYLARADERAGRVHRALHREDFEANLEAKLKHPGFLADIRTLLSAHRRQRTGLAKGLATSLATNLAAKSDPVARATDASRAARAVRQRILVHLPTRAE